MNSRTDSDPLNSSSRNEQRTISLLFDDQVARTPGATAIVFAGQELTYRQLDQRVSLLARDLQSIGVAQESLVAIFMDRSLSMVIGMLAILKAGGAYVPLDPTYPAERTALVIDDCKAAVVLTTDRVRDRLPAVAARVHSLPEQPAPITHLPLDLPQSHATDVNLAYVIYTSGSTGKPKGVMVEHRNVLSFFAAMDRVLGTEPGVWLAVTSISFDISILELLWPLTRGFKVVIESEEGLHTIAKEIVRHGITHFQSTPSLARMLATDQNSLAALGSVKTLLLGGEALPASLVSTLRSVVRGQIFNMYGPTETTIWSTAFRVPDSDGLGTAIPIGQPLANTRAYILDPQLRPVPAGQPGELFLGGEGVARGYWERSELTAERFLPDEFANQGRMYGTGDVARVLPDGNLEFLGRTDFQVKLRGYRIELGEIEAILEQNAMVRQAVVVVREDRTGDKRLVAYVVPVGENFLTPTALRTAPKSKLPAHAVPSHFVFLERLPLTPNGKIDRNALPDVVRESGNGTAPSANSELPRDDIERQIVKAWSEVLGVEHVGLDENIFDLGATSLMVPEVQIELQRRLHREIPLIDLFEFHTVSTLAAHLRGDFVAPRDSNLRTTPPRARNSEGRR